MKTLTTHKEQSTRIIIGFLLVNYWFLVSLVSMPTALAISTTVVTAIVNMHFVYKAQKQTRNSAEFEEANNKDKGFIVEDLENQYLNTIISLFLLNVTLIGFSILAYRIASDMVTLHFFN